MILHIYENELVISFVQRNYKISGRSSIKHVINELFGCESITIDPFIPTNIGRMCQNKYGWDEDDIILNHTLINYYTFGMSEQDKQGIINKMKGMRKCAYKATHYNEIPLNTYYRYCPECVKEQMDVYGEYGFNRLHQVGLVCNKHKRWLLDSNISVKGILGKNIELQSTLDLEAVLNSRLYTKAEDITRLSEMISEGRIDISTNRLRELYYFELKKRGLLYPSAQSVRISEIKEEIINFFSPQLLQFILKIDDIGARDVFVTQPLNRCYRQVHPLYHILMLTFLGIDISSCSQANMIEFKPDVKCYCLNPLSKHYMKHEIDDIQVNYSYSLQEHVCTFSCQCGFVFSTKLNDVNASGGNKIGRIKKYGKEYEDRLVSLRHLGVEKISQCTGLSLSMISRQLNKYDNNGTIENITDKIDMKELNKIDKVNKEYIKGIGRKKYSERYWKEQEQHYYLQVKGVIEKELNSTDKPKRLTKTRIAKEIGRVQAIIYSIDKMPMVKQLIEQNEESVDQYRIRKIRWVIEKLKKNNEEVKAWKIIHILKFDSNNEQIKRLIWSEIKT